MDPGYCPPINWAHLLFRCSDVFSSVSCFVDLETSLARIWQLANNGVRKPQRSPADTCTAELDYLSNANVCSYDAIVQWQIRSSIKEEKLLKKKTKQTTLWAVIERCRRLAVRLNLLVTVAVALTIVAWWTGRGGAAQTNTPQGKDRQAGFKKSRMKASWRRCVSGWPEWIRSSEQGSWFRSRRWRQYEHEELWLMNVRPTRRPIPDQGDALAQTRSQAQDSTCFY